MKTESEAVLLARMAGISASQAKAILQEHSLRTFCSLSVAALSQILGKQPAERMGAALEIVRRLNTRPILGERLSSSRQITDAYAPEMAHLDEEQLRLICCDHHQKVIADPVIATGTRSQCAVDVGILLRRALREGAHSIALVHNHPSGDPTPSDEDREFTRMVGVGASAVGIILFEHVVIAAGGAVSMYDLKWIIPGQPVKTRNLNE